MSVITNEEILYSYEEVVVLDEDTFENKTYFKIPNNEKLTVEFLNQGIYILDYLYLKDDIVEFPTEPISDDQMDLYTDRKFSIITYFCEIENCINKFNDDILCNLKQECEDDIQTKMLLLTIQNTWAMFAGYVQEFLDKYNSYTTLSNITISLERSSNLLEKLKEFCEALGCNTSVSSIKTDCGCNK